MEHSAETAYGPPRMWLTILDEGEPKDTVEVVGNRFTIGREDDCNLVLEDPKVSRRHAEITPGVGPTRQLHDLGSANGTLLNGSPIRPQLGFTAPRDLVAVLSGGEIIQFGDSIVVATLHDPRTGGPVGAAAPQQDPDR